MSHLNWIVSPVKMAHQINHGDIEAANETAKNLILSTPALSYTVVGVAKLFGDEETAKSLLHEANSYLGGTLNATPVIGHAKGIVHYVQGDVAKGNGAMASATRSTTVLMAGAGGFLLSGVLGGFVFGIEAGIIWDAGVCLITKGKKKSGLARIDPKDPWSYVDAIVGVVGDGMAGCSAGQVVQGDVRLTQIETAEKYLDRQGRKADGQGVVPGTKSSQLVDDDAKESQAKSRRKTGN